MEPVASGSYLVLSDGVDTGDKGYREASALHRYHLRTLDEFRACCEGLEVVEPGLVPINTWRPDPVDIGNLTPIHGSYVTVGRKP